MLKLVDIGPEWEAIEREIEEAEGVLSPELEARMDALTRGSEDKVDRACYVLKGKEAEAEFLAEEIRRLQARKKSLEGQAEALKPLILNAVQAMGGRVKTAHFSLNVNPGRPSVGLREGCRPADLPPFLQRTKDPELNKDAATELLKQDPGKAAELGIIQVPGKPYLIKR